LAGLTVVGVEQPVAVGSAQTRLLPIRLQAPVEGENEHGDEHQDEHRDEHRDEERKPGAHKIEFTIQSVDDERVVRHEKSSFIIPH
jgi:hypothetical protein